MATVVANPRLELSALLVYLTRRNSQILVSLRFFVTTVQIKFAPFSISGSILTVL
jgi:hypothetical protein